MNIRPSSSYRFLVTGGAGYVGSAACLYLKDKGHFVWVLDDLSTGHRNQVFADGFTLAQTGDTEAVSALLKEHRFDGVFYFAAKALVSESVKNPSFYFENNVQQTQRFLDACLKFGVKKFIFSSTCAVYGEPTQPLLSEEHPKKPINPYGQTKLDIEKQLERLSQSHGLKSIALRYFNAAGADLKARTGEDHFPETHLIPSVLESIKTKKSLSIFGNDYPTTDGTCIRDYIHVVDLARAHLLAFEKLLELDTSLTKDAGYFAAYNLGSGHGYSVQEVITAIEKTTNQKVSLEIAPRRPGDPPKLIASTRLAESELTFSPSHSDLPTIIHSAWEWQKSQPLKKKAIFLDRDGTLNFDPGYLRSATELKLLPGVGEALTLFQKQGFRLIVISNQSGVARGLIKEESLLEIHQKINRLLQPFGTKIDAFYFCTHHPDQNCECRKPKPKLLLDAAKDWNIDLSQSFMIGDKPSDLEAGNAAKCQSSFLVDYEKEKTPLHAIAKKLLL